MAVCKYCEREMLEADSCISEPIEIEGKMFSPVGYENEYVDWDSNPEHRCHDCGVKRGQIHHPGCDMELCPNCGHQLISCGCLE